jgi:hypothetical protein
VKLTATATIPLLLILLSACGGEAPLDDSAAAVIGDRDNDGHLRAVDCDDRNASVYPGAPERFDGVVNDCAGDPATIDDVLTSQTLNLVGQSSGDTAGRAVASGDIDCDGIDDLLIGAPYADHDGEVDVGKVYVIYGRSSGRRPALDLALETVADAIIYGHQGWVTVNGAQLDVTDHAGTSVAIVGDTNGDGCDDFAIGAPDTANPPVSIFAQLNAGHVYVFRGSSTRRSGYIPTSSAAMVWNGHASDHFGTEIAGAGDLDGDGYDDVAVYAHAFTAGAGTTYAAYDGKVYVLYGDPTRSSGSVRSSTGQELCDASLDCEAILPEQGLAGPDGFGVALAGGDLDQDGLSDLVIGAPGQSKSYIFHGASSRTALRYASAAQTIITGAGSAACLGDLDGDQRLDLVVARHTWGSGVQTLAGRTYLVRGGARFGALLDVTTSSSVAATFTGAGNDNAGEALACGRDTDGDGIGDLLIGAPYYSAAEGFAYLVRGGALAGDTLLAASTAVSSFEGTTMFAQAGSAVALGDLNGDGLADLAIGAIELQGVTADGPGRVAVFSGF